MNPTEKNSLIRKIAKLPENQQKDIYDIICENNINKKFTIVKESNEAIIDFDDLTNDTYNKIVYYLDLKKN